MGVGIAVPYHQIMRPTIFVTTANSAWEAKNLEKEAEKFDIAPANAAIKNEHKTRMM
jgi:hypothetical protein